MSGLVLACAPDIPNYEGFFDGLEAERCGNGIIDFHSEECDEGKDNDSRGFCSPTCKKARCGDGLVQLNEECDLGEDNAPGGACSRLCYAARCGDGIVQDPESCDLGPENQDIPYGTGCTTACQPPPTCGDGMLDPNYEACDDANDSNQDACTNECQAAACGDGLLHVGYEACDDGNDDNTDACLSTCEYPSCGDGFVQAGEECDGQANCNESCIRDRYVFVTKKTHDGNFKSSGMLSGIEVAHSICRARAIAAGIKSDADVLAWLSDTTTSPAERFFRSPGRYVLTDGTVVANSWDDLTDGTLEHPINLSEEGESPDSVSIWSNTAADGTLLSDQTCENWSSSSDDIYSRVGSRNEFTSEWTNREPPLAIPCSVTFSIYCFEQ
ncbi:MAG: hypothetical protein ACPG4T_10340 [Nannocystaceae bacterium]